MRVHRTTVAIAALALLASCADEPTGERSAGPSFSLTGAGARTYVLLGGANRLPANLESSVAAAGGTVTARMDGIGLAVATSSADDFLTRAGAIRGISGVAEDEVLEFRQPQVFGEEVAVDEGTAGQQSVGDVETFRALQWAPDAISAPAAWDAGYMGAGARVAILDGGIYSQHADIAPVLDVAHSASFVPGQPWNYDTGTFWHGTHVAGIVAAQANNFGTVGIAPQATLIGVKVLHSGSGAFSWIIQGIYYASTPLADGGAGADIINMSLGAIYVSAGPGAAQLRAGLNRATNYATQQGTLVLAAAGNDYTDADHTANVVVMPAMASQVVAVSATGPMGWALGANNEDRPASYTNYGQSFINLAGPGGDFALPGNAVCSKPRNPSGSVNQYCWVMDMVMAPCRGTAVPPSYSFCWAAGTSMATPHVAGVAALIVGKYGRMQPHQLEVLLTQSADDLGKIGNDDYYGRGRINALRAVQ